uniref:Uncharacterized protein n=1 Tax=Arundo donax TaxID=35708 RepID=A0A0A9BLK5_ARUDO
MAAVRSVPSSRGTMRARLGGARPTRSATTACSLRTSSEGCMVMVPRSTL